MRVSPGCPCPPAGPAPLGARPQPLAQMHVGCPRGWARREQRPRDVGQQRARGGGRAQQALQRAAASSLGRKAGAGGGGRGQTRALRGPGERACGGDPSTEKRLEMPRLPPESPRQTVLCAVGRAAHPGCSASVSETFELGWETTGRLRRPSQTSSSGGPGGRLFSWACPLSFCELPTRAHATAVIRKQVLPDEQTAPGVL